MRSSILRSALLVFALGATLSAQAVTIGISSVGTASDDGPLGNNILRVSERVIAQEGGYGPLTNFGYIVRPSEIGFVGNGSAGGPSPVGSFYFDLRINTDIVVGTSRTISGTWTIFRGEDAYAEATGSGTFATSITRTPIGADTSYSIFRGDIQAVPEPASMAALGLGAFAMLRRCKKA